MPVRFLIADDVPAQQRLMANVVLFLGGESRLAANGREALRLAEEEVFDIVLMDLQMPELGGIAAADRLIEGWKPLSFRPRIVAVTGESGEDSRALCRAIGMDGFVAKPFTVASLRNSLRQLLTRGHCWQEGPAQRLLDVSALPDTAAADAADHDLAGLEARSLLNELTGAADSLAPEQAAAKSEELLRYARRHGLIRLAPVIEAYLKAVRDDEAALFAGLLEEERADFELALMAMRAWRRLRPQPVRMTA